tara:strand:+ start:976 stop:1221 length:246 start_codon:yes stop_codon:yes gene_type:complete
MVREKQPPEETTSQCRQLHGGDPYVILDLNPVRYRAQVGNSFFKKKKKIAKSNESGVQQNQKTKIKSCKSSISRLTQFCFF